MSEISGVKIHITGIVQGVGFRPFIYGLAHRFQIKGWVRNTSAGVDIQIDGSKETLSKFVDALRAEAPPLARIDTLALEQCPANGFTAFEIIVSQPLPGAFIPISPDVSICDDCCKELHDPTDRRYQYPFINCTNCGPRFTIIEDIPYDRPKTTMSSFGMCRLCRAEYEDPLDRRFHAQPVACPDCGPRVWLELTDQPSQELPVHYTQVIRTAQQYLHDGKILAIKGLGGFHLACDALNSAAVHELRKRKLRVDKPFALMMPDISIVAIHCLISNADRLLLESRQRPIVILDRRQDSRIAADVAPRQNTLGVMLPYTPLHDLLFRSEIKNEKSYSFEALVMTSGNLSEEPIAIENHEARIRLSNLADVFLMHDRPIRTRCDDSVVRNFHVPESDSHRASIEDQSNTILQLRRSRGYAPDAIKIPWKSLPILATGTELKNTFCITREAYAFLSHHIGDMENYETLMSFKDGISHFERLFRIQPEVIAYDLHPDYLATRYALQRADEEGIKAIGVQHHHAHMAACMVEHGIDENTELIGVSFDGTGYGEDSTVWGGEFLIASYKNYQRPFHLDYVRMPGGDKAIREPWRMALSWLNHTRVGWQEDLPPVKFVLEKFPEPSLQLDVIQRQIANGVNAPLTSSIGRLFDAIAALSGVRQVTNYEAQAAIEFETIVEPKEMGAYSIEITTSGSNQATSYSTLGVLDPSSMIHEVVEDLKLGTPRSIIAARFHNGLAQIVLKICQVIRSNNEITSVVLSGGVWQNVTLLKKTIQLLQSDSFNVYFHRNIPSNDGGVALGQAAIVSAIMRKQALN